MIKKTKQDQYCKYCRRIHDEYNWCTVNCKGEFHSFDQNPSYSAKFPGDSNYQLSWHKEGIRHREDGPALFTKTSFGESEQFFLRGREIHSNQIYVDRKKFEVIEIGASFEYEGRHYIPIKKIQSKLNDCKNFYVMVDASEKLFVAISLKEC